MSHRPVVQPGQPVELAAGVHWIGALDPAKRKFDVIPNTANGTSYKAYRVRGGEGVAVGDFRLSCNCDHQHIMRPFRAHVLEALDKLEALAPRMIAPAHGPILRRNPREPMARAVAEGAEEGAGVRVSRFDLQSNMSELVG
jgi:flavorubredoxin